MPCYQSNDRFLVRWRKVRYGTLLVDALELDRVPPELDLAMITPAGDPDMTISGNRPASAPCASTALSSRTFR
jgi:hypothetical protein